MEVAKDTFIVIEYSVQLDDASYVKGENGPVSLNFVVGYDQVLPGLESRLIGLSEGMEKEFVIPAVEAFGEYDENRVHKRSFTEFPEGRRLEVDKWVVATNRETGAQFSYFVKEKTSEAVVLDFNHPLAGKNLHYRLTVVNVRPATREELEYVRPCEQQDTASSADA